MATALIDAHFRLRTPYSSATLPNIDTISLSHSPTSLSDKKDEEAKGKITEAVRKKLKDNKVTFGVVLLEVTTGGPATQGSEKPKGEGDQSSMEEGDIITHVDGKEIKTAADYYKLMSGNDEKKLTIIDVNTDKPVMFYFKPKDGKLGVKFEVIAAQVG